MPFCSYPIQCQAQMTWKALSFHLEVIHQENASIHRPADWRNLSPQKITFTKTSTRTNTKFQYIQRMLVLLQAQRSFKMPVHCYFLLLEVPAVLFIHKNKIQIILHTELVVDVAVCWCQLIWTQEQPNRNWFSCKSNSDCTS